MKIGVLFPQFEIGTDPSVIKDFAQTADDLGYAHITSFDQIIGLNRHSRPDWTYVHDAEDMFHEVMVLFGFMAAVTRHVNLTTGILILPMRPTALVAKQAAEVDVLSGGRLRLGVGIGVKPAEFEACEREFGQRGKHIDSQIALLRELWTNDLITYQDEFHRIEDGGINPLPVQRPIPIWIGGISDAAVNRVARIGDGWLPNFDCDDFGRQRIDDMRNMARQYGRDPDKISIEATLTILDRTPEQLAKEIERWAEIGATDVTVCTLPERWLPSEGRWNKSEGQSLSSPRKHIEAIANFKSALPELFG